MHAIVSAQEASTIRAAIPLEVAVRELDPVVALLVTLYIVYIGQIVGEEMAARQRPITEDMFGRRTHGSKS